MAEELILFTNPHSRGRIARWMLEETGAAYETRVLEFGPPMKTAEYLAINPMGKVPAIRHNGRIVTESAAICAYLADAFPAAKLAPPPAARADYYRWLFFTAGPLEAAVVDKVLNVEIPKEKQGMVGYGSYDLAVETLARAVSQGDYICGDMFTAADVYIGSQVGWGMQFGTLPQRKEFTAYWERLAQRKAYRRATDLDDNLVKAA